LAATNGIIKLLTGGELFIQRYSKYIGQIKGAFSAKINGGVF